MTIIVYVKDSTWETSLRIYLRIKSFDLCTLAQKLIIVHLNFFISKKVTESIKWEYNPIRRIYMHQL